MKVMKTTKEDGIDRRLFLHHLTQAFQYVNISIMTWPSGMKKVINTIHIQNGKQALLCLQFVYLVLNDIDSYFLSSRHKMYLLAGH